MVTFIEEYELEICPPPYHTKKKGKVQRCLLTRSRLKNYQVAEIDIARLSDYIISLILYTLQYFPFNHHSLEPIHISFAPSKGLSKLLISFCFKAPTSCWVLHKDQFPFQRHPLALIQIILRTQLNEILNLSEKPTHFLNPLCKAFFFPSTVSRGLTHHNLIHKNLFIHLAIITKITVFIKNKRDIFSLKMGRRGRTSVLD